MVEPFSGEMVLNPLAGDHLNLIVLRVAEGKPAPKIGHHNNLKWQLFTLSSLLLNFHVFESENSNSTSMRSNKQNKTSSFDQSLG